MGRTRRCRGTPAPPPAGAWTHVWRREFPFQTFRVRTCVHVCEHVCVPVSSSGGERCVHVHVRLSADASAVSAAGPQQLVVSRVQRGPPHLPVLHLDRDASTGGSGKGPTCSSAAGVCLYLQRAQRPLVDPVFNVEQQVSQSALHHRLCCSSAFWDRARRLWVIWKQRSFPRVYTCESPVIHLCDAIKSSAHLSWNITTKRTFTRSKGSKI